MSSAICQNFVQNAWKKELCSNCFKSKDEHNQQPKPKAVVFTPTKSVESIMKTTPKSKTKRNVAFTIELSEVIGYGGENWSDNEEEFELSEETFDEDDFHVSDEEEKELKRLTKANTDFNTVSLTDIPDTTTTTTTTTMKKSFTQLLLGKPQVDAEGRKQTLLVTVTPFGEESTTKKTVKPISHIPIAKNNKDTLSEVKNNVVLTSYTKNEIPSEKEEKSLLDEISETLENGKNPIQIVPRKKIQKEIILTIAKPQSNNKENIEEKLNIDENIDKNKVALPEKKIGIQRSPAIKRDIQEKPAVYQTSVAKIELLNSKNLKNTKDNKFLSKMIKPDVALKMDDKDDVKDEKVDQDCVQKTVIDSVAENKVDEEKLIQEDSKIPFPQSRELAGEPDGRADPDESPEPPALPLTPPPKENNGSFLHGPTFDKPKIPSKPTTMLIRKPVPPIPNLELSQPVGVLSTFSVEPKSPDNLSPKLKKQDSNGSDIAKTNKRKAPMPPPSDEVISPNPYMRNSTCGVSLNLTSDKKEISSSCRNLMGDPVQADMFSIYSNLPEPAPRKSLSMSTDCLPNVDGKKAEKKQPRFSLKRFWRMGANKELAKSSDQTKFDEVEHAPQPKPRLVIVHPSDLNGEKVEVLQKPILDQHEYTNMMFNNNNSKPSEYAITQEVFTQRSSVKPPPPPRNLEEWNGVKNVLPHPPKSQEIINRQKMFSTLQNSKKKSETVYANIGEVRSAIVPNKPQRTASMREREAQQQKQLKAQENYEDVGVVRGKDSNENVYDYINSARSSSPECDSSPGKDSPNANSTSVRCNGFSQSTVDVSGEYFKYQNIPRSLSLTYCGSETESEIYSPYSFYGSESEVAEDDSEWTSHNGRTHKLRSKKGRSIVHKNLEDNYGAVIVANHEALAQVLENIQHTIIVQPALRGLKTASNLRWSDFTLKSSTSPMVIGARAFHQAMWGSQHVTLVVSSGSLPTSSLSLGTFSMSPITEFNDILPARYVPNVNEEVKHIQAMIAVLPWMQVNTIQSYGDLLKAKISTSLEEGVKEASFILLQLVNALKLLQAQGIEELPNSLNTFVLCKEMEKEGHCKLYVLQSLGEDIRTKDKDKLVSLCSIALTAVKFLLDNSKLTPLIYSILDNERAVSLTQVKSVLEFSLWGPSDVTLANNVRERELALQRWLDLQRATVLHGLVCTKVQLTVYEECHLLFLVRSTAKMICDASILLESSATSSSKIHNISVANN